jgi:imidazole glycerol phosphate synthase subunit HisF
MFPEAPVDCSDLTLTLDTSLFSAGYIEIKITAMDKDGTITTFDLGFTVTENTQAITCYTSAGCTGNVISTNILPRSCCVGNGISYHDGMDCFECILWGFQNSNGDPITQLPVSELGLSFSFEVNFTTIKGHLEKDSVRVADITSTPINASADEYSFTDVTDEFNILTTIGIYILTDSVALEGNETFSINASLVNDNPLLKPAENEFVADPLIVIIQDVNGNTVCNWVSLSELANQLTSGL